MEHTQTIVSWQDTALGEFNTPLPEQLAEMRDEASTFTLADFKDQERAPMAHKKRIELRDARVKIEKIGKSLRADALSFQKSVIEKEKELIGIIEPSEQKLKEMEDQAERDIEREKRKERLPDRKARIAGLVPDGTENPYLLTDEEILDMDAEGFETFITKCKMDWQALENARKAKADAEALAMEAKRLADQKAEIDARRKEIEDREAKLQDEKDRIARDAQIKKEAEEDLRREADRKEAEDRAEKARIEKEKVEAEAKLAKRADYIKFLQSHGYSNATKGEFIIRDADTGYELYKRVGTFNK